MVHKNVPFSFPDCSPYFDGRITETHQLFRNPAYYIHNVQEKISPSHVVIYDTLLKDKGVKEELFRSGYKLTKES